MSNPSNKPSGEPAASTPKSRPLNTTSGPPTTRGIEKRSVQDGGESAEVPVECSSAQLRESQSGNDDRLAAVECSIEHVRALLKHLLIASPDLGARSANTPLYTTQGGHFMYSDAPQYRTPMAEGLGATSSTDVARGDPMATAGGYDQERSSSLM
ncbi:hypothetical protein LPJ73_000477 [Coemansia sp. RSA 2703]|nr:hypothetical protein LPJ73_000477 [Coemansia sp. RSA 2703]KAJ2378738.1 hypothetical protein IW150_000612 [Coemansia sp. RSA 2607]KAJ2396966.1 hypothetical protein GGI05_000875 [Coemansia sp. RSA 2603]